MEARIPVEIAAIVARCRLGPARLSGPRWGHSQPTGEGRMPCGRRWPAFAQATRPGEQVDHRDEAGRGQGGEYPVSGLKSQVAGPDLWSLVSRQETRDKGQG